MSRKQRSLARKMHNKLYLEEALLDGTSETLPRIKEANKRREAAYLAAIGK